MPSRAHLMVKDGDEVQAGDYSRRFRGKPPKRKTSPAVSPAWSNSSKLASRAILRSSAKSTAAYATATIARACARFTSRAKTENYQGILDSSRRPHQRAGRRSRQSGRGLIDGPLNLHDLLAVLGEKFTQAYLVNAIQEVYRLQGVTSTTSTSKPFPGR